MLKLKIKKRSTANSISRFKEKKAKSRVKVETVIVEKKVEPLNAYPYHGSFHGRTSINVKGRVLTFAGTITGCGLGQVHGVTQLGSDVSREDLLTAFKDVRARGCGSIICTLGQAYYNYESSLLRLGFEKLAEYPNLKHGMDGSYKQRIYLLKL